MTNTEKILKEREILNKVLDKTTGVLLYTHNKLKITLALSISLVASPFVFAIWFFDNNFIFFWSFVFSFRFYWICYGFFSFL